MGLQVAANITQTLHNRAQMAWTCHASPTCHNEKWESINPHDIPWEDITEDQFTRLILYLLSQPYIGDDGKEYPTYNAWGTPHDIDKIEAQYPENWSAHQQGVGNWLQNGPGMPSANAPIEFDGFMPAGQVRNQNVLYFYSTAVDLQVAYVYRDRAVRFNEETGVYEFLTWQYYFTDPYP